MPLSNRFSAMAEYARSPVVRDRLYGGLMAWSAGQLAQPVPPNPDDRWIRLRMVAERIPQSPDHFAQRIAPYTLQTADIADHIADHLAPYLEADREDAVQTQITGAIQGAIPLLAVAEVPQGQIDQWRTEHHFPTNGRAG